MKRTKILLYCQKQGADIIYLQETHLTLAESCKVHNGIYQNVLVSPALRKKGGGVCILVRRALQPRIQETQIDPSGRWARVRVQLGAEEYLLMAVYGPTAEDPAFFQQLAAELRVPSTVRLVIGGDFNMIQDPLLDRSPYRPQNKPRAHGALQGLMETLDLVDPWRLLHPTAREYTFYSMPHHTQTRIDYFLISKMLVPQLAGVEILPKVISDHAAITMILGAKSSGQPRVNFRMDKAWLADTEFVNRTRACIDAYLEFNKVGDTATWASS